MKHIDLQDLSPLELAELRFCVESLGLYTEDEIQFIYNNLYRDDDGLAYYYAVGNLTALYID